jgi:membrane-associated protease RseP (regulator of RpoE activity)
MRQLMLTISIIAFLGLALPLHAAPRHTGGQSLGTGSGRASTPGAIAPGAPLSVRAILGSPRINAVLIGGYGYPALFGGYGYPALSGGYGYPALSGPIAPSNLSGGTGLVALPGLGALSPAIPNPGVTIPSAPLIADPLTGDASLPDQIGMQIIDVIEGGAAKKADLRQNDVILGVENRRVNSFEELQSALAQAKGEVNIIFINGENGRFERLPVVPVNGKIGVAVAPIHLK